MLVEDHAGARRGAAGARPHVVGRQRREVFATVRGARVHLGGVVERRFPCAVEGVRDAIVNPGLVGVVRALLGLPGRLAGRRLVGRRGLVRDGLELHDDVRLAVRRRDERRPGRVPPLGRVEAVHDLAVVAPQEHGARRGIPGRIPDERLAETERALLDPGPALVEVEVVVTDERMCVLRSFHVPGWSTWRARIESNDLGDLRPPPE